MELVIAIIGGIWILLKLLNDPIPKQKKRMRQEAWEKEKKFRREMVEKYKDDKSPLGKWMVEFYRLHDDK